MASLFTYNLYDKNELRLTAQSVMLSEVAIRLIEVNLSQNG